MKHRASDRAFGVPQVQLGVFKRLDGKDLTRSAMVCKAWATPALDAKWRTCTIPLTRLLSKLSPLEAKPGSSVSETSLGFYAFLQCYS